jgi:hypothetical protein
MERFKLRKLNTVEVTEDICNLRTKMITWTQTGLAKISEGNIKISAKESLGQYKHKSFV